MCSKKLLITLISLTLAKSDPIPLDALELLSNVAEPISFNVSDLPETQALEDPQNRDGKIVRGFIAKWGDFPYITYLELFQNKPQRTFVGSCTGSLIDYSFVLTAAHCVSGMNGVNVRGGIINRSGPSVFSTAATNGYIHPNYDTRTNINDIALLKISVDRSLFTTYASYVGRIPLPTSADINNLFVNYGVWIAGFGKSSDTTLSNELRYGTTKVISNSECSKFYGFLYASSICVSTANNVPAPCQGDSGGPLITSVNGKIFTIGVVSFGGSSCMTGMPVAYSRVTSYLAWIKSIVPV